MHPSPPNRGDQCKVEYRRHHLMLSRRCSGMQELQQRDKKTGSLSQSCNELARSLSLFFFFVSFHHPLFFSSSWMVTRIGAQIDSKTEERCQSALEEQLRGKQKELYRRRLPLLPSFVVFAPNNCNVNRRAARSNQKRLQT